MCLKLFASVSDAEMHKIYEDVVESKNEGLRPRSLDPYIKTLREHCEYETVSQAAAEVEKLFYKELADRYFKKEEINVNKWRVRGYSGFDDFDGFEDCNINYVLYIDKKIKKNEVEKMLFERYKKNRTTVLDINIEEG